jgi:hypothetical protein
MRAAFVDVQLQLALNLRLATGSIDHPGVKGGVNEQHWIDILRAYLPNRYQVDTGIVIDSLGGRSDQMDVVIFDRQYTPTILDQKSHRYIPAEALYAVFECKPKFQGDVGYAGDKAASVRRLKRTSVAITHAGGVFEPRTPFPIVSGMLAARSGWSDGFGKAFRNNLPATADERLDCGCALDDGGFDTFGDALETYGPDGGLIRFLFRLLGKLQSLGTVPAIDWNAYASVLDVAGDPT